MVQRHHKERFLYTGPGPWQAAATCSRGEGGLYGEI